MGQSIQQLFSQLTVGQLAAYLTNEGWVETACNQPSQRRYELEDDDSPYVMLLPVSDATAGAAALVQNAVRNLSCIVDRQPAELVQEMLQISPPPAPPTTTAGRYKVRVRKTGGGTLSIHEDATGRVNTLNEGEAIEIVCHVDETGLLEMELDGSSLRLVSPRS